MQNSFLSSRKPKWVDTFIVETRTLCLCHVLHAWQCKDCWFRFLRKISLYIVDWIFKNMYTKNIKSDATLMRKLPLNSLVQKEAREHKLWRQEVKATKRTRDQFIYCPFVEWNRAWKMHISQVRKHLHHDDRSEIDYLYHNDDQDSFDEDWNGKYLQSQR